MDLNWEQMIREHQNEKTVSSESQEFGWFNKTSPGQGIKEDVYCYDKALVQITAESETDQCPGGRSSLSSEK